MTPAEYRAITDKLVALDAKLDKVLKALFAQSGGEVADDRDLDSEWGDPTIKFEMPDKDWQGPPMAGKRFSQCPVEWLDAKAKSDSSYAEYLRGPKKGTDEDLKKAAYREKDAARARGWAKRIRGGWRPAGAARPQGASRLAPPTPTAAAYGQAPPRGFGADATRDGQQAGYGGGGGYGAPRGNPDADPVGDDSDVPF